MAIKVSEKRGVNGKWLMTYTAEGIHYVTKSAALWYGIKLRCQSGTSSQKARPTYKGCSMSDNFKDYQLFTNWYVPQVGYGVDGYHIDKDILYNGNKLYGEDTCVLVPLDLNNFFVSCNARRGDCPQGLTFRQDINKYQVVVRAGGRSVYLGVFADILCAKAAYKKAKEAEAYRWYERLKAGEFKVDDRVIERMRTWTFEEIL